MNCGPCVSQQPGRALHHGSGIRSSGIGFGRRPRGTSPSFDQPSVSVRQLADRLRLDKSTASRRQKIALRGRLPPQPRGRQARQAGSARDRRPTPRRRRDPAPADARGRVLQWTFVDVRWTPKRTNLVGEDNEKRAEQEITVSPLPDSNRRPPPYHEREEGVDSCGIARSGAGLHASDVPALRHFLRCRATLVRPV